VRNPVERREEDGNDGEFTFLGRGTRSDRTDLRRRGLFRTFLERERSGTSSEMEEYVDDVLVLRRFIRR
jgi:hypothetical protein